MTDIEKLAAAVKKRMGLGSYAASIIAGDLFRGRKALGISVDQLHGLIEGIHVIVPVEPTEEMIMAAACTENDFESLRAEWKAMIEAAQEDL